MDATGDTGKATAPQRAPAPQAEAATPAPSPASDHPFGPDGAAILATEHWSLLAARSLLWNEAQSRATVFLSVLSAATIALALLADATGFGAQTTTLALVLLPVVLFLGIAAHGRLVEINREEVELVLAMNRLRRASLRIAPALEPYFTTGHHDDEQGLAATYLAGGQRLGRWGQFLVDTPTIVATVDAALGAAIVVLVVGAAEAATAVAVVAGTLGFLVVWVALFWLQRRVLDALRRTTPRLPTPPNQARTTLPIRLRLDRGPGRGARRRRPAAGRPTAPDPVLAAPLRTAGMVPVGAAGGQVGYADQAHLIRDFTSSPTPPRLPSWPGPPADRGWRAPGQFRSRRGRRRFLPWPKADPRYRQGGAMQERTGPFWDGSDAEAERALQRPIR
jgi:hypothetical protein